jgi:hypothetical protein
VYTIVPSDVGVLVGGFFTGLGNAQPRDNIAAIDLSDYTLTDFDPNIDSGDECGGGGGGGGGGTVYALALLSDASTLYLGGDFCAINGGDAIRSAIAAVNTADGLATPFNPNILFSDESLATVYALALSSDDGRLYAGGDFNTVNGVEPRSNLAAFDTTTGTTTVFDFFTDDIVRALTLSSDDSVLYVGGDFSAAGNLEPTGEVLRADTETGLRDSDFPNFIRFDTGSLESVHAIISDGAGGWYVGGDFTHINGIPWSNLAHITSADALDTEFDAGFASSTSDVLALALSGDGSVLYAGGAFETVNVDQPRNNIAAFDTVDGSVLGFNPDADDTVDALALSPDDGTLYVGGEFTSISDAGSYFVGLDTGTAAATAFAPAVSGPVYSLALSGDGSLLYAGGDFLNANSGTADVSYLAAFDTTDGTATVFDPGMGGAVRALALSSDDSIVYAGGEFQTVADGATDRNFLASFTTDDAAVTPLFNPNLDGTVRTLALSEDDADIYAGGIFNNVNGAIPRNRFAGFETSDGTVLPISFAFDDSVFALSLSGTDLLIGGGFTSLLESNDTRNGIAAIDIPNDAVTSFDPNVNSIVRAFTLSSDDARLYAGGDFTSTNDFGADRNRLAAFQTSDGSATSFIPDLSDSVRALALSSDDTLIYAGGDFRFIDGGSTVRRGIAAFNSSNGVAASFAPAVGASVYALVLSPADDELYVGAGTSTSPQIYSEEASDTGGEDDTGGSSGRGGGGSQHRYILPHLSFSNLRDLIEYLKSLLRQILALGGTLPPGTEHFLTDTGTATGVTYTRNLQLNDAGPDVVVLQQYLIAHNAGPHAQALATAGATGLFGPLTQAALAEFQASVGITPAAGFFGPVTKAYVESPGR